MEFHKILLSIMATTNSKYYRAGWNGKGMYIEAQYPTEDSKMTRPYLVMVLPKGSTNQFGDIIPNEEQRIPWLPSQTDLFSNDWQIKE